jgi:hypothetical protein
MAAPSQMQNKVEAGQHPALEQQASRAAPPEQAAPLVAMQVPNNGASSARQTTYLSYKSPIVQKWRRVLAAVEVNDYKVEALVRRRHVLSRILFNHSHGISRQTKFGFGQPQHFGIVVNAGDFDVGPSATQQSNERACSKSQNQGFARAALRHESRPVSSRHLVFAHQHGLHSAVDY